MTRKSCPFDHEFDFDFRPESYVPAFPTMEAFLSKINGTARRDIARRAVLGEDLARVGDNELYRDAMEFVLLEELSEAERRRWGSVHPAMMGGEFLPELDEGEIEIARIDLRSVTADAISIRARKAGAKIQYRVVDEYSDEGTEFEVFPPSSEIPLSFDEVVQLIDMSRRSDEGHLTGDDRFDVGLFEADMNAGCFQYPEFGRQPSEFLDFVRVSSGFYPQLSRYYEQRSKLWVEEATSILEEEAEERVLENVVSRLTDDSDFSSVVRRLVANACIDLRLHGVPSWELGLPLDTLSPTINRVEVEEVELCDAASLGELRFALELIVEAVAEIDCFVPKSVAFQEDSCIEIKDEDCDRWHTWAIASRPLLLSVTTIYDEGTGLIDDPYVSLV